MKIKPKTGKAKNGKIKVPKAVLHGDDVNLYVKLAEEALHGERKLFDTLSVHEKTLVIDWLSEALIDGDPKNELHDLLWEVDYIRKPVDPERFLMDEYYFGKFCKDLHPKWVDDFKAVFKPGSTIYEWIMTGAIGVGKTTVAMASLGYKIHLMSCLRNPSAYYGLLPESLIIFGIYSVTKQQVADTGYYKLRGWFDSSPYFRHDFPRKARLDSKVDFSSTTHTNLQVIPGSRELHALGLDLFSFSLDEANFMQEKRDKERGMITGQAYELYNAVHARIISRFIRPGGVIPGIMLLMSSRNSQTSFLEDRLKKIKPGITYVSDYPLWEVKDSKKFTMPKFSVEVGDRIAQSRVLDDDEKPREGARVITDIPGELREFFVEDTDQALRDIAGVATFNVSPLIRDRQSIYDAVRDTMTHPFTKEWVMLDYQDDIRLDEFFMVGSMCKVQESSWVPKLNPNHNRFIHVDGAATGDCAAIAMAHVSGMVKRKRSKPDGTISIMEYPFVIVDFLLRILPPPSSEIDLAKIRSFILYLSKLFPIARVTFDGWQSLDSKQMLVKSGMDAKIQSLDQNDGPYLTLRNAHFERRIAMYDYKWYTREMLDLERNIGKKKVDHPTKSSFGGKGSKDVSDAVCGAVYLCMTDERAIQGVPLFDEDAPKKEVIDPKNDKPVAEQNRVKVIAGKKVDMESLRNSMGV